MVEKNIRVNGFDQYYLLEKYQQLLSAIYKSQVLGHVYLEQFNEYNNLTEELKLQVKNKLRLFYLKKPEYLEALRLIQNNSSMDTVLNETGISKRTYYKLINIPFIRKYIYGIDYTNLNYHNAFQKHLITYDNLADSELYDAHLVDIENYYFLEKST